MATTRLTAEDWDDIFKLRESGMTLMRLAEIFKVSTCTISNVLKHKLPRPEVKRETAVAEFRARATLVDNWLTGRKK